MTSDEHTARPVYGPSNPQYNHDGVQRFASVIGLRPDMEQRYRELHANAWKSVQDRLKVANVQNYSIYLAELEGKKYLFSYLEYTGDDYKSDMQTIADDPETQRWWAETDPCQIKLPSDSPGENWCDLERLFLLA